MTAGRLGVAFILLVAWQTSTLMFRRAGRGCVRIDLGAECGVVEKSGAWLGFSDERIGQGREDAKQFLRDHPTPASEKKQR